MMLPEAADNYLPVVASWLLGEAVTFEEKDRLGVMMATAAGVISPGYPEDIAEFPEGSVAIVNLRGELTKYDGLCNFGAMSIANLMRLLGVSKNISGVVLDIDGPGGAVNAIAPVLDAIKFVQGQGKPVVVHGDLVASAHLYIAVYGDHFMLDNRIGSRAGSIGTLIQFTDYREYWKQLGVTIRTIYAPESTHKNQEYEKMLEGDDEPMKQQMLSPLARNFQEAVKLQRGGKLNLKAEGILNGAMFWAQDAVDNGLADSIGTLGDAIQRVLDLVEIRKFMSFSK